MPAIVNRILGLGFCFSLVFTACKDKDGKSAQLEPLFPAAGGATTISNRTSGAFTLPASNLNETESERHLVGDRLFEAEFVSPPARVHAGLGPVFNNTSCRGCHIRNGRGMPALGEPGNLRSHMLVRLSLDPNLLERFPEQSQLDLPLTAAIPVPGFGTQLQDHAVYGQEAEAVVTLSWEEVPGRFADGTSYTLRRPVLKYSGRGSALLNDPAVLRSLRQTPPVVGLGLLEAVPESTLLSLEDPDDRDGDGISGRLNRVWDVQHKQFTVGRFGWKASAPSLLAQAAGAFAEDMGVSNPLVPQADGSHEISWQELEDTAYYTQTLAVPSRDRSQVAKTQTGERLFSELQCASCHRPSLITDNSHPIEALRQQQFFAYTDLLLHDMGEDLADGRADWAATGREWRTSPLWGLGLTHTILPYSGFLHDGRARTIEEAILWHGGEAEAARERYKSLSASNRQALLDFLRSL